MCRTNDMQTLILWSTNDIALLQEARNYRLGITVKQIQETERTRVKYAAKIARCLRSAGSVGARVSAAVCRPMETVLGETWEFCVKPNCPEQRSSSFRNREFMVYMYKKVNLELCFHSKMNKYDFAV